MPDGWRWPDDGRWACQLRQDAQHAHSKAAAGPRAHQQGCHSRAAIATTTGRLAVPSDRPTYAVSSPAWAHGHDRKLARQ